MFRLLLAASLFTTGAVGGYTYATVSDEQAFATHQQGHAIKSMRSSSWVDEYCVDIQSGSTRTLSEVQNALYGSLGSNWDYTGRVNWWQDWRDCSDLSYSDLISREVWHLVKPSWTSVCGSDVNCVYKSGNFTT